LQPLQFCVVKVFDHLAHANPPAAIGMEREAGADENQRGDAPTRGDPSRRVSPMLQPLNRLTNAVDVLPPSSLWPSTNRTTRRGNCENLGQSLNPNEQRKGGGGMDGGVGFGGRQFATEAGNKIKPGGRDNGQKDQNEMMQLHGDSSYCFFIFTNPVSNPCDTIGRTRTLNPKNLEPDQAD
jgi:hypothetical protein